MTKETVVVLTPTLSPDKIVILALIAAYCAGILPKKTHRPLLATIVRYIEGPSIHDTEVASVTVPTFEEIIRRIREACIKSDSENGVQHADDIEIRVLHAIWTIQSLDSLHSFIIRSKSLLVTNLTQGRLLMADSTQNEIPRYLLTRSSFLGKFVSSCIDAFEALEFDKANLLWDSFTSFREPSRPLWNLRVGEKTPMNDLFGSTNPEDDPTLLKSLLHRLGHEAETHERDTKLVSQNDLSILVNYQMHIFESYGTPTNPNLKDILTRMSQSDYGKIPSTHYINYLECLRDADFEGSFNALHRYFDYMMSNRFNVYYHYALLSLASLYASFNCDGEAIRAIEESISVARENKDLTCLNFLLTWIYNFLKDRPSLKHNFYVSNHQLLQFLKSKAGETSGSLHSIAYQSDATQLMLDGGSLTSILESLTKAMYISVKGESKLLAFISYCGLASSFWLRAGNYDLSDVYTEIALDSSTFMSQKVEVMIRKAHLEFTKGDIESCFKILEDQKSLVAGDVRLTKTLVGHRLILQARQSLRMSRYNLAKAYLSKLEAQEHVGIDLSSELALLCVELELKLGNVSKAFQMVSEKLNEFASHDSNKLWFSAFNVLKCQIIAQGSSPARGLSMCVQCLNSAANSGFINSVLHAIIQLVTILLKLGELIDANELISEALPQFEQAGDCELKSLAYQQFADVQIKLFKQGYYHEDERVEVLTRIIHSLEVSVDGLNKISYFDEIRKSLLLQLEIGEFIEHADIMAHAKASIEKIDTKIKEELTTSC
ncbi:CYFA0S06e00716g1_1 [Cyberlindnera fabianii]|uniref:Anaphase-promoting complex subunit 5 n=1 Tax=Cyberlindnera fabianii TaxID=36022 RepID=A0A061B0C0_CYBFA|nr:CYFA0S06e00716g1_1 [Cyberlindnera fabianii]